MHQMIEVDNKNLIISATKIINESFFTVANEFNFTRENAPTFPAYILTENIEWQIKNGMKLFLYEENERFIGCVGISYRNESYLYKVERLAVIPDFRHKGIGKILMNFIEEKVKNLNGQRIIAEIVNENTRLKQWYLRHGYSELRIDKYDHLPFTVGVLEKRL